MRIYPYELVPLPYPYEELKPVISDEALFLHHDKHMRNYIKGLNEALKSNELLQKYTLCQLVANLACITAENSTDIKNNAGGVYNHSFFFEGLLGVNKSHPMENFLLAVKENFGGIAYFKAEFEKCALELFGSGWVWLVEDSKGRLKIIQTTNQNTPVEHRLHPIMCIDLWEHAYYYDYKNRRHDYVKNFWKIVNWNIIENRI